MPETLPDDEPLRVREATIGPTSVTASIGFAGERWPFELRGGAVPFGDSWADAVAVAMLLPAMRLGRPVEPPEGVSPRLLAGLERIQEVLVGFDRRWGIGLRAVPIAGAPREERHERAPGVACLFSGGADSFYSLRKHRDEITHLLFVQGFDVPLDDHELLAAASRTVNTVADGHGKQAIEVRTDLRAIYDGLRIGWPQAHGSALAAVALLFQDTIGKLIVPSTFVYSGMEPWGSHPLLDPNWSTERLEVVHDGAEAARPEKIAALADDELAMKHLRVCWENRDGAYNCGRCEKCVRTMINLRIAGALGRCATLPDELDMDAVAAIPIYRHHFLIENIAALEAMERPDPDLHAALLDALRRHEDNGAQARLDTVLGSWSWRLTAPLRRAGRLARRARGEG